MAPRPFRRRMECTAYCSCGYCCNWEWGLNVFPGRYLALLPRAPLLALRRARPSGHAPGRKWQLLDKYWTATPLRGEPYLGLTATETEPTQARRGLLHPTTWADPKRLLWRAVLPWRLLGRVGTVAADPEHLAFGTQLHVPGHGWCRVEDTGGDILGPTRLDLFYHSHADALRWGRRTPEVLVVPPGASRVDRLPGPVRGVARVADAVKHALY